MLHIPVASFLYGVKISSTIVLIWNENLDKLHQFKGWLILPEMQATFKYLRIYACELF